MQKSLLTFSFFLISIVSYGQIETDRPDFTESPNVVPKSSLQIETGFIMEVDYSAAEQRNSLVGMSERNYTVNTTLLRFGLTDNIELRFNWAYQNSQLWNTEQVLVLDSTHNPILNDIKGFNTSFIGFKTNLYKSDRMSIGFLGHLYIPSLATQDYSKVPGQQIAPEFLIPCTYDLTDRFGIAVQYGLSWDGFTTSPTNSYTLALSYGLTDRLGFYVEPYGYISEDQQMHLINGGFTFLQNDNIQFDLTGGAGLNEEAPDLFVGCGASFLIGGN